MADNLEKWREYTSDESVLHDIRGISIDFIELPESNSQPFEINFSHEETIALDAEVEMLLKHRIIQKSQHEEGSFYGHPFTRPKENGTLRVLLNLKKLTPLIEKIHFKLDTIKTVIHMMRPNCFFASIDFKHAFFSIRVRKQFRKYLKFVWRGQIYEYVAMAQGLGPASRFSQKF